MHAAVDTLGHLLALKMTAASDQERAQVGELMALVQKAAGGNVRAALADQGYTRAQPSEEAAKQGDTLEVVKLSEAKKGFVLLPKHWVVERTFCWQACFRRPSRDYEHPQDTLAGLHRLTSVFLMLHNLF